MPIPNYVLPVVNGATGDEDTELTYHEPDFTLGNTNGFLATKPTELRVRNDADGGQDVTCRIKQVRVCSAGGAIGLHDWVKVVPAGESREFGFFDHLLYRDLDGYIHFVITTDVVGFETAKVGVIAVRKV